jgi:hypothetical protein
MVAVTPAKADHRYNEYGYRGYTWFATFNDYATADVTSDNCNGREVDAYQAVLDSTAGKSYMNSRWPSGIRFRRAYGHECDGTVTNSVDIRLDYRADFSTEAEHGNYGGENHSFLASSSWCDTMNSNYPCGSHPSVVHLNKARWTSDSYSHAYRQRLIMHETGHSLGLAHHCSADSIMNDGTSDCNGGAWTSTMKYLETDRKGIYNIYPDWRYN